MAVEKVLLKIPCDSWLVVFGVLVAILLRNITMLHPYSGQGNPPMFGDYEAQRHWMEITTNLPPKQWYFNTSNNNLQYWGLDYPPLTAYHMYLCGLFAEYLNENYTKLHDSRGFESEDHKLFMRISVLTSDILIYIPSLVIFYYTSNVLYKNEFKTDSVPVKRRDLMPFSLSTIMALLYPGIILVDHGHFQFNCVSLGLTTFSVIFLLHQKVMLASIFFCLALNYKQMELYHSLPFFFYLLGTCVPKPGKKTISGLLQLFWLAVTVISTFAIIWLPFIFDINVAAQVLHRQFPFSRGIFEDKVANFWCSLNVIYKLKTCDSAKLLKAALFTTLSANFPSSLDIFLRPNLNKFLLALINSSLAFFLFSFQVHEKTILVVALPVMLYFPQNPIISFWFLYISVFSMIPLFIKDELVLAAVALLLCYSLVFYVCMSHYYKSYPNSAVDNRLQSKNLGFIYKFSKIYRKNNMKFPDLMREIFREILENFENVKTLIFLLVFFSSLLGSVFILTATLVFDPPERYPDLFSLIVSVYSCLHFLGFFVYFNVKQIQIPQDFGDIENVK